MASKPSCSGIPVTGITWGQALTQDKTPETNYYLSKQKGTERAP
jgi:hypothetical protein